MIYLTPIQKDDFSLLSIADWRNQTLISLRSSHRTEMEIHSQNRWVHNWKAAGDEYYFIKTRNDGQLVGYCGLDKISKVNKTAEMSLLIGSEFHRKGLGKYAVRSLLGHGFEVLGLNCIFIEVYRTTTAWQFWEKCGFIQEGTLKARKYWEGCIYDSVAACMLENEYLQLKVYQNGCFEGERNEKIQ